MALSDWASREEFVYDNQLMVLMRIGCERQEIGI